MPLESRLNTLYVNRFSEAELAAEAKLWSTLCDAHFQRYIPAGATVLDIGAGYCDFINHIRAARRIGVDLNPDTTRFAAEGVEIHRLPLERMTESVEGESVDVAFASNVFEHLRGPDALLEVLAAVHEVLKPGGRLIVMQPNVRALGGAFWDFVHHTLPLTEKGMTEALEISGFRVVECRDRFLPYTTKSRLPQWPWLVRLYLSLPLAHRMFGKQMFIVARKSEQPYATGHPPEAVRSGRGDAQASRTAWRADDRKSRGIPQQDGKPVS